MRFAMIFQGNSLQNTFLSELNYKDSIIQDTFKESSEYINHDLWKLITNNTNRTIINNCNQYLQAAILTYSVAIYKLWKKKEKIQ
ncbi:hypothetical protein HIC20_01500 [Buchnera aphidicola (Hormaphis cornu)]|nr:hypothetical protein HIC20_01500 [Buchnera aphidicola (Hormaphis cornu)]